MNSLADVWTNVLESMSKDLSETTIRTWFDEIDVVTMEDSAFVLHCGNSFKKETVENRFLHNIKKALRDIFSQDFEVKILDDEGLMYYQGVRPDTTENILDNVVFTFNTFVVGPQNKLAYSAARSVSEKPGVHYNPLFIYGDSGLGKTHLLYAIANNAHKLHPNLNIVYIKGDDFTNELVAAIRTGNNNEFRDKYRKADILLMDDIQFIAGKIQTQEEFFHTFNTLKEAGHQIVLTSDRPPKEISTLEDRLRTRFEGGLLVDITVPDFETRQAIIKNKASMLGVTLPDKVTEYIASNVKANVRQIEGTLNKIMAYRDLLGDQDNSDAVARAIEEMLKKDNEYIPTPSIIIDYVCKYFNIDSDSLRGFSKSHDLVTARFIAMYLIRRMTTLSLKDIGKEFGGRDHASVLYALNQVDAKMKRDMEYKELIREITSNINDNN